VGAFRTSSIDAMQIEAEILSVKVRLDRKCKNYAIRVIGLSEKHPRISGKQRLFHTHLNILLNWA